MSWKIIKTRFIGFNAKQELKKLLVLVHEDLSISFKNKRLWSFIILMLLPSIILTIVGFLIFIPQTQSSLEIFRLLNPDALTYEKMVDSLRDSMKDMYGLAFGYWLNLPIVIVTAIYTSEFIAGERAKGSFDLFSTKPILRSFLVLSKTISFAIISYIVTFIVYGLLFSVFSLAFIGFSFDAFRAVIDLFDIMHTYILATWLFVMAVAAVTILFSAFTKRALFATFGSLAYFMGYGIGVSLISTFVPGTLGTLLSEQLSYVNVMTDAQVILVYWLTGEVKGIFQLTTLDPLLALAFLIAIIVTFFTIALITIETKDLL